MAWPTSIAKTGSKPTREPTHNDSVQIFFSARTAPSGSRYQGVRLGGRGTGAVLGQKDKIRYGYLLLLHVTEGQSKNKIDRKCRTKIRSELVSFKYVSEVTPAGTIPEIEEVRKGRKKGRREEEKKE